VSCDGIPFGSARNVRSQRTFVPPNVATATRSSAPQIAAHNVIVRTSTSRWCFLCSDRGSVRFAKCPLLLVRGIDTIASSRATPGARARYSGVT
jgi:hypothetical protein